MSKPPIAKPSRLGRGLSSLMGSPITLPAPTPGVTPGANPGTTPKPGASAPAPLPSNTSPAASTDSPRSTWNAPAPTPAPGHGDGTLPVSETDGQFARLPLHLIAPNPGQPRRSFDDASLHELAASIKSMGVMQPIVVRRITPSEIITNTFQSRTYKYSNTPAGATQTVSPAADPGSDAVPQFQIIAGERRWRAAQIAGQTDIPALVRNPTPREAAEWALIENLQREDLNPLDRAHAFRQLIQQHQLTIEALADALGQNRSSISNALRLLDLAPEVQELVRAGKLTFGQARTLLTLANPIQQADAAHRAIKGDWSVRALEQHVRSLQHAINTGAPPPKPEPSPRELHLRDLEANLAKYLGTKVQITLSRKKGAGTLAINFHSLDHFESLLHSLGVKGSLEP